MAINSTVKADLAAISRFSFGGRPGERGFTLIEVILTLVLAGILSTVGALWISKAAESFVLAQQNAETVQKGQIAMTRLVKEINALGSVSASSSTGITFMSYGSDGGGSGTNRIISYSGGTVSLNNGGGSGAVTLVDNVAAFNLAYYDTYNAAAAASWSSTTSRLIEITLTLNGAAGTPIVFTGRGGPRK